MTKFDALYEFENFYDSMHPAEVKNNEAFAWFSGIPHPLFNAVMHLHDDTKVDDLIAKAPAGIPIAFWVHSQNRAQALAATLTQKGFQSVIKCPLMSWTVKSIPLPSAEIARADMDVFHQILATTLHMDEAVKEGFSRLLDNTEAENYLIYLNGTPVGTGTLLRKGINGGIFNVATLPDYQNRGCGRAMTQFLMMRAADLELQNLILLSSPQAEKLYSSLGFARCLEVEVYVCPTV